MASGKTITKEFMIEMGEADGAVLYGRFHDPLIAEYAGGQVPDWRIEIASEQCADETLKAMLRFKAEVPDLSDEMQMAYKDAVLRSLKVKLQFAETQGTR